MKVCFFGSYVQDSFGIPSGNGGILLKKNLELQGVEVVECHQKIDSPKDFLFSYLNLFFKHRNLKYDFMVIPWRGILTFPLAKLIHKKPIIYFPAFSIYDTLVNDRKTVKKNSIRAGFIRYFEKLVCRWADLIILESTGEINYFVKEYGLTKSKFCQCPLSADESIFFPTEKVTKDFDQFRVLFFGSFIPLHGVETIIESAKLLAEKKDIYFVFCGDGQTKKEAKILERKYNLKNIEFMGFVSKNKLLEEIKKSDVCLGIFGKTDKAKKVVTNKVFQILACKKPLITMDSPAIRENGLKNLVNSFLVSPSSPRELADAILELKNNDNLLYEIANNGYETYKEKLSMNVVGKKILHYFEGLG